MARGKRAVSEDGAPAKKRAYSRKTKSAEGAAKGRRVKKPVSSTGAIFGIHAKLYEHKLERMVNQAKVAETMRKHLENMRDEINKLGASCGELGQTMVEQLARCGMELLDAEIKKPILVKSASEEKSAVKDT